MNTLLQQQQALLAEKLCVIERLQNGLAWSLERLPELAAGRTDDPAIAERAAAIVDRYCKLQDQLAGTLRHAHAMLGDKQRSFHDVVTWAVAEQILPDEATWLELRSLRNRLTHEYDLSSDALPELMDLIRHARRTLENTVQRLNSLCRERGLVPTP